MTQTSCAARSVSLPEGGAAALPKVLVSIVLPCFNEASVIGATLCALQSLRAVGVELVASDDASTDTTVAIARPWVDLLVVNPGVDRGAAGARNRGALNARGDILVFLDADVVPAEPLAFVAGLRRLFLDPAIVAAVPACLVSPAAARLSENVYHRLLDVWFWCANRLGIGLAGGWCQIVRRADFVAVGGFDPRFSSGQDLDLFLRLARRGKTRLRFDLLVLESPRRFRSCGLIRTAVRWLLNGLWVALLRRPFPQPYPTVR